jgi:hypothetical protein
MTVAASAWCVACGAAPELTITVEPVGGVLAHFGSCRRCSGAVLLQALDTIERAEQRVRGRAAIDAIDVGEVEPGDRWAPG